MWAYRASSRGTPWTAVVLGGAINRVNTMKSRLAVWAIYLVSCGLVCVAVLEIALRLYLQMPVFTLRDWRTLQGRQLLQTSGAVYDPLLGWSQASNFVGVLSRFLAAHILLGRYRDFWYSGEGPGYVRASNVPAKTSCHMLERLQDALAPHNIPAIVVLQYGGWIYARAGRRPHHVDEVLRCARDLNYAIVDEFNQLSALARASLSDLKQNYVMAGENVYGHMSAKGNALIASLIAEKLRTSVDLRTIAPLSKAASHPGDGIGINRIVSVQPETFIRNNVDVQLAGPPGLLPNEPVYRIAATAENGEHYIVLRWSDLHPGPHTFSTFVRSSADNHLTIQLHDDQGNGAVAYYSFPSGQFTLTSVGAAKNVLPRAEHTPSGWLRISVATELTGGKGTAIIQISLTDPPSVQPGRLLIQGMMVEYGSRPSPYCRPRGCMTAARVP